MNPKGRVVGFALVFLFAILAGCAARPGPRSTSPAPTENVAPADSGGIQGSFAAWSRFEWSTHTYSRAGTIALSMHPSMSGACTINFGFAFRLQRDTSSLVMVVTEDDRLVSMIGSLSPYEGAPSFVVAGARSDILTGPLLTALKQDRAALSGTLRPTANQTLYVAAPDFEPWGNPGTRGASITLRVDCPDDAPVQMRASNETFLLTQDSFRNGTGAFVPSYATAIAGAQARGVLDPKRPYAPRPGPFAQST